METVNEIIKRLGLKYRDTEQLELELPINIYRLAQKFGISEELVIKFQILNFHPDLEESVRIGVNLSKSRYKGSYQKKAIELDSVKVCRKIKESAKLFKESKFNCTPLQLVKDPSLYIWWKMIHFPVIENYGVLDLKIQTLLDRFWIGSEAKKQYEESMYPYGAAYWVMRSIQNDKTERISRGNQKADGVCC